MWTSTQHIRVNWIWLDWTLRFCWLSQESSYIQQASIDVHHEYLLVKRFCFIFLDLMAKCETFKWSHEKDIIYFLNKVQIKKQIKNVYVHSQKEVVAGAQPLSSTTISACLCKMKRFSRTWVNIVKQPCFIICHISKCCSILYTGNTLKISWPEECMWHK